MNEVEQIKEPVKKKVVIRSNKNRGLTIKYQTPDGEALRNDAEFQFISAWNWTGENNEPELIKEPLVFEESKLVEVQMYSCPVKI